jgi:hypothetical protein
MRSRLGAGVPADEVENGAVQRLLTEVHSLDGG